MAEGDLRARLKGVLSQHTPFVSPLPDPVEHRVDAAVLVFLHGDAGAPLLTMTLRAPSLRDHGGEISFPGGKPDPGDADLRATALREAREEIGLEAAEVLGRLTPMPTATSRFRIHPYVAWGPSPRAWRPSVEVARVLDLPLRSFVDGTFAVRSVPFSWAGHEIASPFFVLDEGLSIYGASAYVLMELLLLVSATFGWEVPSPELVSVAPWGRRGTLV